MRVEWRGCDALHANSRMCVFACKWLTSRRGMERVLEDASAVRQYRSHDEHRAAVLPKFDQRLVNLGLSFMCSLFFVVCAAAPLVPA